MGKIIKQGKVVVLLSGRYAGKKAIVVKANDDGTKDRKFGHCLVAGISKYPRKVQRRQSKKVFQRRTNIKPFVKFVNFNHIMPTRYQVTGELDVRELVKDISTADKRSDAKKGLKNAFQNKYRNLPTSKSAGDKTSHLRFFFNKLRF